MNDLIDAVANSISSEVVGADQWTIEKKPVTPTRYERGVVKLCECGCGQPAPIAKKTDSSNGRVAGKPQRFIKGHQFRRVNPLAPVRVCLTCGVEKPAEAMRPGRRECKECAKERLAEYRRKNLEAIKQGQAAYREQHRAELNAKQTAYYYDNHEEIRRRSLERGDERKWRLANPQKSREKVARRRARIKGSPVVEMVDREAIIRRDKSTCYLCNVVLEAKDVTLDHVIPLAKGGHHTAANLKVACRPCNLRKSDKVLV